MSDSYLAARVVITNAACSLFQPPTHILFVLLVVRVYLCDSYTRCMVGYPRMTCYCSRPMLPLTDVQWRANLQRDCYVSLSHTFQHTSHSFKRLQ